LHACRLMAKGLVMKKIYVFVAAVLVSTFAFASEPGDGSKATGLAVVKKNETTFNLFYQAAGLSNVKVSILDANGKEVFSESIVRTNGFVRPYNFEALSEGEYTFSVDDGIQTQSQLIQYRGEEKHKAANVIRLASNKYLLAIRGDRVSGKVNVKIYDGSKLVHEQFNEVNGDFGQVFRMKNIDEPVSFEVTDSQGNKIN
jgi:hypothetical protein